VFPAKPPYYDNTLPFFNSYDGRSYPLHQTLVGADETIGTDFVSLTWGALYGNAAVYALEQARVNLFKQARPMWRRLRSGTPGELFSTAELEILRNPWPGGTTSDLLSAMALSGDIGGVAFVVRPRSDHLAVLRPDWVQVAYGTRGGDTWSADAEMLGIVYQPGGRSRGQEPVVYLRDQVAVFIPMRDPMDPTRGMSWMRPAVREISADSAATSHKLLFYKNGATPSLVMTGVPGATPEAFNAWVAAFSAKHDGMDNAYRSMYLSGAVDAKVVGSDLQQMTFKEVQGAGQTILAAAAGVPPVVVGFSEGLAGSSLNSGNFAASMRRFADLTGRPWWADAFASLAAIVPPPPGAELFYDDRYIPALKDDLKDAADVQAKQAQAMRQLIDAGFEPDSVVDAINAGDMKRLKHSGLYSVQLQLPVPDQPEPEPVPEALAADDDDAAAPAAEEPADE
jgi:phage portal protein BeeE